jgi:hypothetical protein
VSVPDEPPALTGRGWRALLEILVADAENKYGPGWREHLHDESESTI